MSFNSPIASPGEKACSSASLMTAQDSAQLDWACKAPAPWESLPPAVLGRCLRPGPDEAQHAPFSTCKTFMKSLLLTAKKPGCTVRMDDYKPALARVLLWTAEWQVAGFGVEFQAAGPSYMPSLWPFVHLLHQEHAPLPNVSWVRCKGVILDACAPARLEVVFPNLHQLYVDSCKLPAVALPLTGCTQLRQLHLAARHSHSMSAASWLPQLQQLASLPSLAALTVDGIGEYSTSDFLPLMAGQLTELHLSHGQDPAWQAALSDVVQLTQLHTLQLSGFSLPAQQLGVLSSLGQLQDFQVGLQDSSSEGTQQPRNSDALIRTLLGLSHITRLTLGIVGELEASYADQPCTWKQLRVHQASPDALSKLPLHSLTHPLQLAGLMLGPPTSAADVGAAAANLARSQAPFVCSWDDSGVFEIQFGDQETGNINLVEAAAGSVATLLRAAAQFVPPDITSATVQFSPVAAEVVVALREVLPATVTSLQFNDCIVAYNFWPQLARSFPQLERLEMHRPRDSWGADELLEYFRAAAAGGRGRPGGTPRAASLQLQWMREAEDEDLREDAVGNVNEHLRLMGFRTPQGLPTSVHTDIA